MASREVVPGQVVRSCAGRDRGRWFVVLARPDDRHALVADGELRPVGRPKRKNLKHLEPGAQVADTIAGALARGDRVGDLDVRRALEAVRARPGGPAPETGQGEAG